MAGPTVKELISRSRFTVLDTHTALMLMQNLLRILQYLQSKTVIHNDIKGTELCFRWWQQSCAKLSVFFKLEAVNRCWKWLQYYLSTDRLSDLGKPLTLLVGWHPIHKQPAPVITNGFYPRDAVLAWVLAVALCLSVSMSVTSRCSVKRDERISLVFDVRASFDQSYTVS